MPKPSLDDLTPAFIAKTQKARNPQLAIEALRQLIADESASSTRNDVIRQRAFFRADHRADEEVHEAAADIR